jgi:hypothetical protein
MSIVRRLKSLVLRYFRMFGIKEESPGDSNDRTWRSGTRCAECRSLEVTLEDSHADEPSLIYVDCDFSWNFDLHFVLLFDIYKEFSLSLFQAGKIETAVNSSKRSSWMSCSISIPMLPGDTARSAYSEYRVNPRPGSSAFGNIIAGCPSICYMARKSDQGRVDRPLYYRQLDATNYEIWLLMLHTGTKDDEPVNPKLWHFALTVDGRTAWAPCRTAYALEKCKAPPHTWCNTSKEVDIAIDGNRLPVTKNLFTVRRSLRHGGEVAIAAALDDGNALSSFWWVDRRYLFVSRWRSNERLEARIWVSGISFRKSDQHTAVYEFRIRVTEPILPPDLPRF